MSEVRGRLQGLIGGYRVSQMIRAAALIGICDRLAAGPRTSAEVASEVGANPDLLHRLMRALVAFGVLAEGEDGRFSNLEMGELLRTDSPQSLRDGALALTQESWWDAWRELTPTVREGYIPLERVLGMPFWEMLAGDPEWAARFNGFMVNQTSVFVPEMLGAFDFASRAHVVDIGGGNGALIAGVLEANPSLRGTVFDLEAGLDGARELLARRGVADRCSLVPGSFFESVPGDGDTYLLRMILHDWEDERAAAILATIRRALRPESRLLVIDFLLPERATDSPQDRWALTTDLHMHVLFGSRERTEAEMRRLLGAAGFEVERVVPTSSTAVMVAAPA